MKNPSPVGAVTKGSPARSRTIINARHILVGKELLDHGPSTVIIENGVIAGIEDHLSSSPDYDVDVLMPLLVNTHIHTSDYRVPERCIGLGLGEYVGSKGLKHPYIRLYRDPKTAPELEYLFATLGLIGDYQEIHNDCVFYREWFGKLGIDYIGLSRPMDWNNVSLEELLDIAGKCGGIGVSNPLKLPRYAVDVLGVVSRRYVVSAHVSETRRMEERGSLHYLLSGGVLLRHVVHGVYLEDWELRLLADYGIVLVVNPRSNLWFTGRIASVEKLIEYNGLFALGTDNAGCFHPDVLIEAEYLYTLKPYLDPRRIVEALTVNGYHAMGVEPPFIEENREAYMLGLDLGLAGKRTWNIYASIIRRAPWSRRIIVFKKDIVYTIDKRLS